MEYYSSRNVKWHVNIVVICSCALVITVRNILTIVRYINIYPYNTKRAYQSCILSYSTHVSLLSKCVCSKIQAYPPHVYHVVILSHYWAYVHMVTYRPINTTCTIKYMCLSNGPLSFVLPIFWYIGWEPESYLLIHHILMVKLIEIITRQGFGEWVWKLSLVYIFITYTTLLTTWYLTKW